MRNYEVTILNYEAALKISGGLQIGDNGVIDLTYKLTIPDDRTHTIEFCVKDSDELIGTFEVGMLTVSLILNREKDIRFNANVGSIGDSQIFHTVPPIKITRIE